MGFTVVTGGINIYLDVVDGVKGHLTNSGWELRRKVTVSKLGGLGLTTTGMMLWATNAMALLPAPIYYGASHPDLGTCILEDITPQARAPDVVEIDLIYRQHFANPNNLGLIEVGASITNEQTNVDYQGNPFVLKYAGTQVLDPSDIKPQGATISTPKAQPTLKFTRQETGSPGANAELYVGSGNDPGWSADPSAVARAWLCTGILGVSKDGGQTYQVSYTFTKKTNGGTWDERLVWVDPKTGRPPSDVSGTDGTKGILIAQVVTQQNFNALGLV